MKEVVCKMCGVTFKAPYHQERFYCSRSCSAKASRTPSGILSMRETGRRVGCSASTISRLQREGYLPLTLTEESVKGYLEKYGKYVKGKPGRKVDTDE